MISVEFIGQFTLQRQIGQQQQTLSGFVGSVRSPCCHWLVLVFNVLVMVGYFIFVYLIFVFTQLKMQLN